MESSSQGVIEKALARIDEIDAQIGPLLAERNRLRVFVNQACEFAGREPMFPDSSGDEASTGKPSNGAKAGVAAQPARPAGQIQIRPDMFFNQPLATAVRLYLEARKELGMGPASADDIHDALIRGGYGFPSRDTENQKRGLQVSLSKNTITFRRLPNELYGLAEWYPSPPRQQRRGGG
jgi:hypothetical protein